MLYHKKALPNRQCTSFHATGCHFTGPVALRPRLSSGLSISLLFLNFCKKTGFIILWFSTVYKKNITALTPENQKKQPIHILELFFYFRNPRSIDITVSCSFVFRSFHILNWNDISTKRSQGCRPGGMGSSPERESNIRSHQNISGSYIRENKTQ